MKDFHFQISFQSASETKIVHWAGSVAETNVCQMKVIILNHIYLCKSSAYIGYIDILPKRKKPISKFYLHIIANILVLLLVTLKLINLFELKELIFY